MNYAQLVLLSELIAIDAERKRAQKESEKMSKTSKKMSLRSAVQNTPNTPNTLARSSVQTPNGRVFVTFETPYSGDRGGCDMAALTAHETSPNRVQFSAHQDYQTADANCEHARYCMKETVLTEAIVQHEGAREYAVTKGGLRIRVK